MNFEKYEENTFSSKILLLLFIETTLKSLDLQRDSY